MDSQFSVISVADRQKLVQHILDYADTTHLPEQVDMALHCIIRAQMIHTLHEIADKILHCGYVIDQIKHIANELTETHNDHDERHLTSSI